VNHVSVHFAVHSDLPQSLELCEVVETQVVALGCIAEFLLISRYFNWGRYLPISFISYAEKL
jgi:hypothetical protein